MTGTVATSRSSTLTPGRVAADHHGPLEHAGRPAGVTRRGDGAPLLEGARPGHGQPHDQLGADVDVGQAGHAEAPEEAAGPARLPHDRGVDDGAGLDRLERVHLDAGLDHGVRARRRTRRRGPRPPRSARPGAGHRSGRATQPSRRTPGAEEAVVVDDGALERGVVPDADVGAEHAVRAEDGAGPDVAVVADDGRAPRRRPSGRPRRPCPARPRAAAGTRSPGRPTFSSRMSWWARR